MGGLQTGRYGKAGAKYPNSLELVGLGMVVLNTPLDHWSYYSALVWQLF